MNDWRGKKFASPLARCHTYGSGMNKEKRDKITKELKRAYGMELETVQNYLANSVDFEGVRAEEIKKSLGADFQEEIGHAKMPAKRIKVPSGRVPDQGCDQSRGRRHRAIRENHRPGRQGGSRDAGFSRNYFRRRAGTSSRIVDYLTEFERKSGKR